MDAPPSRRPDEPPKVPVTTATHPYTRNHTSLLALPLSLPSIRRPVKKRRVKSPPSTATNGSCGAPPTLPQQQRRVVVVPDLIPERDHQVIRRTTHPTTLTTTHPVTRGPWELSPNDHLKLTRRDDHDDDDDDDDDTMSFSEVPAPPPLVRSVAQVIRTNDHHHDHHHHHHHHHAPSTLPLAVWMEPRNEMATSCSRLPMSPFRMPPQHRPTWSSNDPLDDPMMTSRSVSTLLPAARSSSSHEASRKNFKNHNKLLPKQPAGVSTKNTTCLITADDSDNDALYQSLTTTNNDGTKHPGMSSSATIPPSLMSGKVVSTKYGLAMLVVPACDVSIVDYTNTFTSSTTAVANHHHHPPAAPFPPPVYHHNHNNHTGPQTVTNRFKHWSKSEDDLLLYAMSQQVDGPPYMWQQISHQYFSHTRNGNQCKSRWKKIDPSLAKEAFTAAEDEMILKGEREGLSWPEIAHQLPGRNSDQIRSRFINAINPRRLKNVAWTADETRILHQAQSELGNKWSVIASLLPGRSENDIKNHWHNQRLKMQRKLKSVAAHVQRRDTLSNLRQNILHSDASFRKTDRTNHSVVNDDDDNDDDNDAKLPPSNDVETTQV